MQNLRGLPPEVHMACFEVLYFNDQHSEHRGVAWFENLFRSHGLTILDPFLWFDFYYHGIIVRKNVLTRIGGYLDQLTVGEDQDILLRATESLSVDDVAFVHWIGYEYRNNSEGVCVQRWSEVERNYAATMLAAARRRGGTFTDCRFAGTEEIGGALIDVYEYKLWDGRWISWDDCRLNLLTEEDNRYSGV